MTDAASFAAYLGDTARIEADARFCSMDDGDRAALPGAARDILSDRPLLERLATVAAALPAEDAEWRAAPWRELADGLKAAAADASAPVPPPKLAFALVFPVLANLAQVRAKAAERAIPDCIVAGTWRDIPRWIGTFAESAGGRFRAFAEISWLHEHVRLRLFELGRLQFQPGTVADADWGGLAKPGDPAINVHIPAGAPLDPVLCDQSFAVARNFFAKFFPESPTARAKVFQCSSWMLCPQLGAELPETSRIRAFAARFRTALPHGNADSFFKRIFPVKRRSATEADASTSLQKALLKLVADGVEPQSHVGLMPVAPRSRPLRLGVLGSGSGSNMQSIQDAIEAGTLDAEIRIVITDVPGAKILDRATRHGIPARHIDHAPFRTKLEGRAEDEVVAALKAADVDVVVLAGYMRVVKAKLLAAFPNRVVNIHPALLPSFPGIAGWTQALEYGAKVAGCTVHFVNAGIDSGPIIVQRSVPVEDADTPASLHARIQVQEHLAYPEALRLLAADRLLVCGRRVLSL